jgi:aconitase B
MAVAPTKRGLQKKDSFDFSDSDSDSDSDASSIDMNDETVDESLKIGVAIGTGVQPCT